VNLEPATQYLWHGITWATGKPALLLAGTTGHLGQIEVIGLDLGLRVASPIRHCTGRYRFSGTFRVEPVPCPQRAEAGNGGQCPRCLEQDEFRFAHHVLDGGHVTPSLSAYLSQPHWLYVATFAHGTCKVGTAAAPRRKSRLDEQAAMCATYLTEAPDGHAVRHLEDTVSRKLGMPQAARGTAKVTGLISPDPSRIRALHEHAVQNAVAVLAGSGIRSIREEWAPPLQGAALLSPQPAGVWAAYPYDLRQGEHGFRIESCAGTVVLARLSDDPEAVRYVIDLNVLKGRRVVFGDFSSPPAMTQAPLF
jgi:hypothetical protein